MTDTPKPVIVHLVVTDGQLLDLDVYRMQRITAGTWPPTSEDQHKFFVWWKEYKKRG